MPLTPIYLLFLILAGCASKPGVQIVRAKAGLALNCEFLGEVTDGTLVSGSFGLRVGEPTTIKPLVELTRERGGTHLLVEGVDGKEPVPNVGTAHKCPAR